MPEPTLRRLPWYLSNIKLMKEKGEQYVSSTQISKEINIDASQIAKDLSYVNISGRTRVGYNIDALIEVLESFLGFTGSNSLYKNRADANYQLVLHQSGCKPEEFNKVCNILSEYGRQESFSLAAEAFLLEHGNAMVKENALQELASL